MERLKYIVSVNKGKVPKKMSLTNTGDLPIYLAMDYLRNEPKHISYVPDFDNCVLVDENEILLLWDGSNAGEFMWSKKGVLSSTMAVIKPKTDINKSFLFYQFKEFERYLKDITVGMGIPHVNPQELFNYSFYIPAPEEQTAIANYLDQKTAEIDELIAQKEQLLKLYEEEKTVIINQAVTKGINPDVKLKDSGIDWLGDIPEHWEVKKLKYFITKVGSGVTPRGGASVYLTSGIPLLRSQNVHFDGFRLDDVAYISETIHNEMSNSKVLSGDVLLNITGASIGRCFYVSAELGEANVNQHVCIIRPKDNLFSEYLYFILRSFIGQEQINIEQTGSGREGLNFEALKSFIIPKIEIKEQNAIVQYIETEIERINTKAEKTKKLIDLLLEYKQSLISEVVTGKVKITN